MANNSFSYSMMQMLRSRKEPKPDSYPQRLLPETTSQRSTPQAEVKLANL